MSGWHGVRIRACWSYPGTRDTDVVDSDSSSFSHHLRRLRERAGLTQAELAERAGLSVKAIGALESGRRKRPYPSTVRALSDALGLSDQERMELTDTTPGRSRTTLEKGSTSHNLPTPPSPIIGRERELAQVVDLLTSGKPRMVTFTGAGGVGKTRLALEVAWELNDSFAGRTAFVPLATTGDPALVLPMVAQAAGLTETSDPPSLATLAAHLNQHPWFLVLDNLEHLLDVAPNLASLLAACPELTMLATSRAPLRIRAEHEYPVKPLDLPDLSHVPTPDDVAQASSVQLFLEHARAAVPDFELTQTNCAAVATICRRLEGLPLALELVAARVRALSPTELLARLDRTLPLLVGGSRDLPERQQTMQAAISWSYDMLEPNEQVLFRRLSVFNGGWTLDAAEVVAGSDDLLPADILDLLLRLVEKSLVLAEHDTNDATRYRMLQPIAEFARHELEAAHESHQFGDRHLDWCLELARAAVDGMHGPEQHQWLLRLDQEHDNLRTALSWCRLDASRKPQELQLAGLLWMYWETRGHLSEGRRWLEQALADSEGAPAELRANAFNAAGNLAYDQGDHRQAAACHEVSLALRGEIGDVIGMGQSHLNLGNVALDQGDRIKATELYTEALRLFREAGSVWDVANALNNLGIVLGHTGEYDQATGYLEEAIILREPLGEAAYQARSLDALGEVMRKKGDLTRARELHERSLALRREIGDSRGTAVTLRNLGLVAFHQGHIAEATAHIEESLQIRRAIENRYGVALCLSSLARIARHTLDDARSLALYCEALEMQRQLGVNDGLSEILLGIAAVLTRHDRPTLAAHLFGASERLRDNMGQVVAPVDRDDYEQIVAAISEALPPEEFESAREAGRGMALEESVDEALSAGRIVVMP